METDEPRSREHKHMISLTGELRLALQDHLLGVSEALHSKHIISTDAMSKLQNQMHEKARRASELVVLVLNKVKEDSSHYYTFVQLLEELDKCHSGIVKNLKELPDGNGLICM